MTKAVYRDMVFGAGRIRYLHWWNRWYWKRRAVPYKHDGVERYLMPRILED